MKFFLGTHHPHWLWRLDVPLFVSRRRLAKLKRLRPAGTEWALDSGGFTEIKDYGRWTITPQQYVEEARRWLSEVGSLRWCAQMDWMCEPVIRAKSGLTTAEHQRRTVDNYLELAALAPEVPWAPVIQGWHYHEYLEHLEMWAGAGVNLASLPVVGLGSVCRRQATTLAENLIRDLHGWGIRVHAFGFKTEGLGRTHPWLESADSMAWSFIARARKLRLPGCTTHRNCANCPRWALRWRETLLSGLVPPRGGADLFSAIIACAAPGSLLAPCMSASSGPCSG